jgi:hypothetical protein
MDGLQEPVLDIAQRSAFQGPADGKDTDPLVATKPVLATLFWRGVRPSWATNSRANRNAESAR